MSPSVRNDLKYMDTSSEMHPLLYTLLLFVLVGLIQRVMSHVRINDVSNIRNEPSIGVILVAPPMVDVESRLKTMLSRATRRGSIRLYVAKACGSGEGPLELVDMTCRIATRMYFVRDRHNTPQKLRAALVREVLEDYVLCIPWHHEVEWSWDDMLLREWSACRDENAVLTTRISNRAIDVGFIHIESYSPHMVSFGRTTFASSPPGPPGPQLSIVCSAHLLMGPVSLLQRSWPTKTDVADVHEDSTLSAFLWMHGARFYCPHNQSIFLEMDHEEVEKAGDTALPSHETMRTSAEFWMSVGIRRGALSSRARAGLTPQATVSERYHKVGQTLALRREL